jgi:hypothetical protein
MHSIEACSTRRFYVTKLSFATLALLAGVGCGAVAACSSSGDDTSSPTGGAGGASGGAAGKAGATGTAGKGGSTGTVAEAGAGGDAGTIYDRLGGNAGITTAVAAIVGAEVTDLEIASYFSQSTSNPNYSPSVTDIEECLVLLLDSTTGGPQTYLGTKVTSGFACQSMVEAHADLGINSGTFTKFVTIAAGVLAAPPFSVSTADLTVIGGVLNGTETQIVTASPDSDTEKPCTAPAACAEAGAGGAG